MHQSWWAPAYSACLPTASNGVQVKEQLDTVPPFHTNSFKGQLHKTGSRRKLGSLEERGRSLLLDARTESYVPGLHLEIEVRLVLCHWAMAPGNQGAKPAEACILQLRSGVAVWQTCLGRPCDCRSPKGSYWLIACAC